MLAHQPYSHPSTRAALRSRGIRFTSAERSDQLARRAARGSTGGRPPRFDAETYKGRNVVERCFNRLKQWRGIATRYDKTARNHRGGLLLTSLILCTRDQDSGVS
ncbi:MAG TPA: transposase [Mycobacterium sp.]|nr:transposase [Mycobacterium sp.]